jgi:hypothetical protein
MSYTIVDYKTNKKILSYSFNNVNTLLELYNNILHSTKNIKYYNKYISLFYINSNNSNNSRSSGSGKKIFILRDDQFIENKKIKIYYVYSLIDYIEDNIVPKIGDTIDFDEIQKEESNIINDIYKNVNKEYIYLTKSVLYSTIIWILNKFIPTMYSINSNTKNIIDNITNDVDSIISLLSNTGGNDLPIKDISKFIDINEGNLDINEYSFIYSFSVFEFLLYKQQSKKEINFKEFFKQIDTNETILVVGYLSNELDSSNNNKFIYKEQSNSYSTNYENYLSKSISKLKKNSFLFLVRYSNTQYFVIVLTNNGKFLIKTDFSIQQNESNFRYNYDVVDDKGKGKSNGNDKLLQFTSLTDINRIYISFINKIVNKISEFLELDVFKINNIKDISSICKMKLNFKLKLYIPINVLLKTIKNDKYLQNIFDIPVSYNIRKVNLLYKKNIYIYLKNIVYIETGKDKKEYTYTHTNISIHNNPFLLESEIHNFIYDVVLLYYKATIKDNDLSIFQNKQLLKTKLHIKDIKKEIGETFNSRECQKKRQPSIVDKIPDDYSTYSIKFKDKNIICINNPKYKYPGYTITGNLCCFKIDQRNKDIFKKFNQNNVKSKEQTKEDLNIKQHIIKTDKFLLPLQLGEIVNPTLKKLFESEKDNLYRIGVTNDNNTLLNIISLIYKLEQEEIRKRLSSIKEDDYIKLNNGELKRKYLLKEYIDILQNKNIKLTFDLIGDHLERLFNIHIIIFNINKNKEVSIICGKSNSNNLNKYKDYIYIICKNSSKYGYIYEIIIKLENKLDNKLNNNYSLKTINNVKNKYKELCDNEFYSDFRVLFTVSKLVSSLDTNFSIKEQYLSTDNRVIYIHTNYGILPVMNTGPIDNVKVKTKLSLLNPVEQYNKLIDLNKKLNIKQGPLNPIAYIVNYDDFITGIILSSYTTIPVIVTHINSILPETMLPLFYTNITSNLIDIQNTINLNYKIEDERVTYMKGVTKMEQMYDLLKCNIAEYLSMHDHIKETILNYNNRTELSFIINTIMNDIILGVKETTSTSSLSNKDDSSKCFIHMTKDTCEESNLCIWYKNKCMLTLLSNIYVFYKEKLITDIYNNNDLKFLLKCKISLS